uniref:Protein kinase domain-containing protein n=1 Tax=Chlamydomonas euryale TaxID=1486919 RepID=A0A7R9V399_9CHLO|mmetsp:Transcript_16239/g.48359  ORF Transcript_16239/g.48359 Transcript_16239/m.48359 type:complete len:209 (+) Transcript_16239:312-938(+)
MGCLQSTQKASLDAANGDAVRGDNVDAITKGGSGSCEPAISVVAGGGIREGQGSIPGAVPSRPVVSKLRTDVRIKQAYSLGKVLGMGGFSCVKLAVERSTGKEYACKIMSFPTLNPRYTWWCEGACTCAGLKSPFGCVSASGPSSAHVVALHAALACSVCHADDMQGTHACMHACSCMRTSCMHRDGLAWLDACGCMRTSRMNCNGLA